MNMDVGDDQALGIPLPLYSMMLSKPISAQTGLLPVAISSMNIHHCTGFTLDYSQIVSRILKVLGAFHFLQFQTMLASGHQVELLHFFKAFQRGAVSYPHCLAENCSFVQS